MITSVLENEKERSWKFVKYSSVWFKLLGNIGEGVVVMMKKKPLRSQQQNWVCGIVGIHHHRIQGSGGSGGGDASNTRESLCHEPRHTYLCCVLMEEANPFPPTPNTTSPSNLLLNPSFLSCHLEQPICCISQNHPLHKSPFLPHCLNSKTLSLHKPESSFAQVHFPRVSQNHPWHNFPFGISLYPLCKGRFQIIQQMGCSILQGKETLVCKQRWGPICFLQKMISCSTLCLG